VIEEQDLAKLGSSDELRRALDLHSDDLQRLHPQHEGHTSRTVRTAEYRGHQIKVVTTYEIELDGEPVTGHLLVDNGGTVHYHAIPNQEFRSAVDVVKRVVDLSEGLDAPGVTSSDRETDSHHHGGQ
jgi:hypothetical protein